MTKLQNIDINTLSELQEELYNHTKYGHPAFIPLTNKEERTRWTQLLLKETDNELDTVEKVEEFFQQLGW